MPSARVGNHGEAGIGAKLAVGSAVAGGCLLALLPAWDGNCDLLAPFEVFSSEVAGEERKDENSVHVGLCSMEDCWTQQMGETTPG